MGLWFVWWDPCGLLCYLIGQAVIAFAWYVTMTEVIYDFFGLTPAGVIHGTVFTAIVVLVEWSHWRCACTPAGFTDQNTHAPDDVIIPRDDPNRLLKPKRRFCNRCQALKPSRAHHCRVCDRCIMKMDHHCPWVNNCVGQNNVKFFLQFLVYVNVGCTYAALLMLFKLVTCVKMPHMCAHIDTTSIILSAVSSLCAVFFAIFVVAMWCDQWEAMVTDTTGVESMQGWDEMDRPLSEGLRDFCGEPFSWRWFAPIAMPEASTYKTRPTDNPDAFNDRDPRILMHFARLERKGLIPPADGGPLQLPDGVTLDSDSDDDVGGHRHGHGHGHGHGYSQDEGGVDLQCTPAGVRGSKAAPATPPRSSTPSQQAPAPPQHVGSPTNADGAPAAAVSAASSKNPNAKARRRKRRET